MCLRYGKHSALLSGPLSVYPLVFIPSSTARQSVPTKRWRAPSVVWSRPTTPPGLLNSLGLNTPTTPCLPLPQVCPCFSASMVISLPYFPHRREMSLCLQSRPTSGGVTALGTEPAHACLKPQSGTSSTPTADASPHPHTSWLIRYGFPPRICHSSLTQSNCSLSLSVHLSLNK